METYKIQITEREMELLSDGLLALINNANQAMKLVSDKKCVQELEGFSKELCALNSKICLASEN